MTSFEKIADDLYYLKIPFGPVFTSVTLLLTPEPVLVDTGATDHDVDEVIVPALQELGLSVNALRTLTVTHCHGDHIGGLHRLRELAGSAFSLEVFELSAEKVADPVPFAIRIRTAFPEDSPPPQSFLRGVRPDKALREGEVIGGRLEILHTPGHDNDCVCLLDRKTGILLTGDSLQGNGTISQGIGFYQSLPGYRETLAKLATRADVESILLGHDYDGIGYFVQGRKAAAEAVAYSLERVATYGAFVEEHRAEAPRDIAPKLIEKEGMGMPEKLFMARYTVREHLKEIENR